MKKARIPLDAAVAVAYARVSTSDQALSQDAQALAWRAWCDRHRVRLAAAEADLGVSGAAPLEDRPGLARALEAIEVHRAGILLVVRRDRLARDVLVAAYLDARVARLGARVVSIAGEGGGDDPGARLMRQIVDAFAEYERALIVARTRAALGVKRARGERTGGVPFGARVAADGRGLEPHPGELATLARLRALRAEGRSWAAVAAAATAEGARTRTGRPFTRGRVCALVGRPARPEAPWRGP